MDPVIEYLRGRDGFEDPVIVTAYRVYIHNVEVEVLLNDYGQSNGHNRYSAEARYVEAPDDRELEMNTFGLSLGNPDSTIDGALSNVHWNVFPPLD